MSLTSIVNEAWLAELVAKLPGAELWYNEDWQAHILSVGGKQFARLGTDKAGVPIVTLKGDPLENEALRQEFSFIVPGYYSNKQHWNSVILDQVSFDEDRMAEMLQDGYRIVFQSLTKKLQAELSA